MAVTDTNYSECLAITDVMDSGKTEYGGAVNGTGMTMGNLFNVFSSFQTNFNGLNAKLDSDTGVSGTNFASTLNLSDISTAYGLKKDGMHQACLASFLTDVETCMDALLAKLDLDGGTSNSDYASCEAFDMPTVDVATGISSTGLSQGAVVNYFNTVVTCFNALLTKLDND